MLTPRGSHESTSYLPSTDVRRPFLHTSRRGVPFKMVLMAFPDLTIICVPDPPGPPTHTQLVSRPP